MSALFHILEYIMARKSGPKNKATLLVDLNRVSEELRALVIEEGLSIIGDLAEMIAVEANKNAPVQNVGLDGPRRPYKWKNGGGRNVPLKGNIIAFPSPNRIATWIVQAESWFAHFVEYGTWQGKGHYTIKANNKESLRYKSRETGKMVWAKSVQHPPSKPQPFLRPAADRAEDFLMDIIRKRYGV